jgi:branched-chain amino acid transport system ATP-binding protein
VTSLLSVRGLTAGYGQAPVVRGIDIDVNAGELVALLGPNGAGKSTTLLALSGVLPSTAASTFFDGRSLSGPLHLRAARGLGYIPEGRSVFPRLTVEVNLRLAGDVASALGLFPELEALLGRQAGLLSGGEQQILTLARALTRSPKLLLVDELSLGLAPMVVARLLDELRRVADLGVGILVVEQHASRVLPCCDRGYVMQRGQIRLDGTGPELIDRLDELEQTYLHSGSPEPAPSRGPSR